MAVSSPCSSGPLRLLLANIQYGRASTALLCRRLRELDINISLIQEPWAYQGEIRGIGIAGGSLFYCTSGARPRACIHAKNVDATLLPGFCHRDLVAVKIKVVDDTKGKTRGVIVGSPTSVRNGEPSTRAGYEEKSMKLEDKIDEMEQYNRRKNIRIYGIAENPRLTDNEQVEKVFENMNIQQKPLMECYRTGKTKNGTNDKPRPIFVKWIKLK
ncbi:hypothetical protein JTB14_017561 [Gonioctena quinquepunctata]|nr:hypothetical protein JTB14_017561 [Gonioctena quinquepunctata]